jgi:hypothetical protein
VYLTGADDEVDASEDLAARRVSGDAHMEVLQLEQRRSHGAQA